MHVILMSHQETLHRLIIHQSLTHILPKEMAVHNLNPPSRPIVAYQTLIQRVSFYYVGFSHVQYMRSVGLVQSKSILTIIIDFEKRN